MPTGNDRGAVYGWDETLDNSGDRRVGHRTPVQNLYLDGAWTRSGHGYGAVIQSGLECFAEVAGAWAWPRYVGGPAAPDLLL